MKIAEKQLRRLIRETLVQESATSRKSKVPWADMSDPDASELQDLIMNRWGGAGMQASASDDQRIIEIVTQRFPGLIKYSVKWLRANPPIDGNLHRGIKLKRDGVQSLLVTGLKGRGQLSSWSDDMGVAAGFGTDVGMYKGVRMAIPASLAEEHMIYSVKAYGASLGHDVEIDEMDENEYVLRDFDIPPKYIRRS